MICCWLLDRTKETVPLKFLPRLLPTVTRGESNDVPVIVGSIWSRSSRKNCFVRLVTAEVARLARSSRAAFDTDSSDEIGEAPTGAPATALCGMSPDVISETICASDSCGSEENLGTRRDGVPVRPNEIWYRLTVPRASSSKKGSMRSGFEKRILAETIS